jgi:hypothetical protein
MNSAASIERLRAQLAALEAESAAPSFPVYDGVTFKSLLADSGQAKVYRAVFEGQEVAAKVFHVDGSALKSFRSEIASLLYGTSVLTVLKSTHVLLNIVGVFIIKCAEHGDGFRNATSVSPDAISGGWQSPTATRRTWSHGRT